MPEILLIFGKRLARQEGIDIYSLKAESLDGKRSGKAVLNTNGIAIF